MTKKIVKLAVIRKNDMDPCPFRLSIPSSCKCAGNIVDRMAPVEALGPDVTEEEKAKVGKANVRLLTWSLMSGEVDAQKCIYADNIFPEKDVVNCSYGDTAAGESMKSTLLGSPFYANVFDQPGYQGLFAIPFGFYGDYNVTRNLFYGIFSLQGNDEFREQIKKIAIK